MYNNRVHYVNPELYNVYTFMHTYQISAKLGTEDTLWFDVVTCYIKSKMYYIYQITLSYSLVLFPKIQ